MAEDKTVERIDIATVIVSPPDEAIWEMVTWRARFDLSPANLAWMVISILDTYRAECGDKELDKFLAVLDARYYSWRGFES